MIGVREIVLSLEQWQMGRKNLRRRMFLVPTPPEQSGGTPSCCWPRAGRWRRWSDNTLTVGRWASAFGEGEPTGLIFEQTGGSPPLDEARQVELKGAVQHRPPRRI